MSRQSAAPSSGSNSIPLADRTIGRFTSGLPRRSRRLQSETPCTSVRPRSSPPPVEPSEFYRVDSATISHIDDDLDWVDGSDPHKLNHFLFQCWLFFRANPSQFSTDEEKINFAMTYLSGVAQDWFEVTLQQEDLVRGTLGEAPSHTAI